MLASVLLDLLLLVTLASYTAFGYRNGLSGSVFVIVGVVIGVIAAFFLAPLVASVVPSPVGRLLVTLILAIGLIAAAQSGGAQLGRRVRAGVEKTAGSRLSMADKVAGAVVTAIASALLISTVAFSLLQLGVPALSRTISGSAVLKVITKLTPDPVAAWLAEIRSAALQAGLPIISGALGNQKAVIPNIDAGSAALTRAGHSVVRITGNAFACGQSQAGSGFVVADDRVITNAHVVAGVSEPTIEVPNGQVLAGRIVYFDPTDDLAVIAVPGLSATPLPLSNTLPTGTDAAVEGYPYGGPFAAGAADVMSVSAPRVSNIYGTKYSPREVYTLATRVREGNSGGPLLSLDGEVAGVVFARSEEDPNVGFAMTMTEVDPVAERAPALNQTVSSGNCIRG
ncbi:MAG: MarP family serine protease [Salinibacterium sp.]|nr:MAG: MarP family serine protease [Salinibacterium sp.]